MLGGSWISIAIYRRPLMIIPDQLFKQMVGDNSEVVSLDLHSTSELALMAVLAPLAVTNLRAQVTTTVWALDASPTAGAWVSTPVPQRTAEVLWQHGERRGLYSRLVSSALAICSD